MKVKHRQMTLPHQKCSILGVFIFYSSKTAAAHSKHEVTDNRYLPELPKQNTCLQSTQVRRNPSRMLVMSADVEALQRHCKSIFPFLAFSRMYMFDMHVDAFK